jgi:hypothetical protein
MKKKTRTLTEPTRRIVWAKSAGRCQFQNCNEPLIGHLIAGNRGANKGYVAHIIADSSKGPRGDEKLSAQLANKPDNVMLLCDPCHREIDKENPDKYSADLLREMKREHEEWVQTVLSSGPESRSHILQFSATIGTNRTAVPIDECTRAIMPQKTPASATAIEIKVRGTHFADDDPDYWSLEIGNLRHQIEAQQIKHRIEKGEIRHLSVFGLAPMPLLIEFGRLLSDISAVTVYQLHREPQGQGWKWAEDQPSMRFQLNQGKAGPQTVALKLALSAKIDDSRVTSVLGDDISIWEVTCPSPHNDVMRREDDLSSYRRLIRQTLEKIKEMHGPGANLSVFPAIPVSCAIELGRIWQPKAHLAFDIFDQSGSNGFQYRHRIES